ncbi:MAG: MobB family relaxase [Fulvivirga sp.]
MPFVKISRPPKYADGNKGSSKAIMDYLDKENEGIESNVQQQHFFSNYEDYVTKSEAIHGIDFNRKGLKNNETKFYEMSISFSEKESNHLKQISDTQQKLDSNIRSYVRDVMDEYAKNFDRKIDGKQLSGNDLVYYAKIERQRRYDGTTKNKELKSQFVHNYRIRAKAEDLRLIGEKAKAAEVEKQYIKNPIGQVILPGNVKEGNNLHVHVVVSRRDASQSVSLSPLANSKGSMNKLNGKDVKIGFNRDNFKERSESRFDELFDYARNKSDYYKTLLQGKALRNGVSKFNTVVRDPEKYASNLATSAIEQLFKKGITKYLIAHKQKDLAINIKDMTSTAQLRKEASKQLAKDLLKSSGNTLLKATTPIPISIAIKAVSIAYNLIKSKSKSQERDIER